MKIIQDLYQATQGSSLMDYCIFNQNKNDERKNKFLSLIIVSLNKRIWFNISDYSDLNERKIDKNHTQVAMIDAQTKKEESKILLTLFNEKEIKILTTIIREMKSYGVLPIKELMDNPKEERKNKFMRSAFFQPFFSKNRG